jgi:phospholipid/cholesterol/gamma-HCH transport system substrate-binding protein
VRRAIREYGREVAAIVALVAIALVASWIIVQEQRLRVPVLEERPFELRAEFETAQAVVPGQGQTIRVAGVRVGDVADVELEDGVAVVTFAIDRDYLPIYEDATVLMRPQTGLKDMFFALDPGTSDAGEYEEGDTISLANTAPDVNLDEVLSSLDADTRAYLRLVVVGLGEGLEGRGDELGKLLGGLGPINRDLERLNTTLAGRDAELARLIHNLNLLTGEVGRRDRDLTELVDASNAAMGAIAEQAPDVQRLVSVLPGTLEVAQRAFADAAPFASQLGPTLGELRPLAGRIDEVANATLDLARTATPVIQKRLRPLVRAARPVIPNLRAAAKRFAKATPRLTVVGEKVNTLGNMTAYNPRGAEGPGVAGRDEGYLYWLGWFTHNGVSVFSGQDAHGAYRRLYLTGSCEQLRGLVDTSPLGPVLGALQMGLGPLFGPGGECSP